MRSDERNLDFRIQLFNRSDQADIARKPRGAGEQHQKFVILRNLDGLFARHMVGGRIEQPRSLQHSRWVGEPYRVPERFNLARGRPARTRASVKILKRRRVQEQRF
jgi:hypothetical protein